MSHFELIAKGIDVAPLLAELDANPALWNQREERRAGQSPHRETDDIWCRYMDPALLPGHDFTKPHESVWYPPWGDCFPLAAIIGDVVFALNAKGYTLADELGGILITRIGPGKQVYPHHDRGTWHSEHYDLKVWLPLRANAACLNWVDGEAAVWAPGDAWTHDNLITHSVENHGQSERICLIMCWRKR